MTTEVTEQNHRSLLATFTPRFRSRWTIVIHLVNGLIEQRAHFERRVERKKGREVSVHVVAIHNKGRKIKKMSRLVGQISRYTVKTFVSYGRNDLFSATVLRKPSTALRYITTTECSRSGKKWEILLMSIIIVIGHIMYTGLTWWCTICRCSKWTTPLCLILFIFLNILAILRRTHCCNIM